MVLADTKDRNDNSERWCDEWPLNGLVDFPIFCLLKDTFLPIPVDEPAKDPELDKEEASNEVLLHEPESLTTTLPRALPLQ